MCNDDDCDPVPLAPWGFDWDALKAFNKVFRCKAENTDFGNYVPANDPQHQRRLTVWRAIRNGATYEPESEIDGRSGFVGVGSHTYRWEIIYVSTDVTRDVSDFDRSEFLDLNKTKRYIDVKIF
jgi:hypothetical protein